MRFFEVLRGVGVVNAAIDDAEISHIEADSRRVGPGGLFVCLRGINADGHGFIGKAAAAGAAAILCENVPPDAPEGPVYAVCEDTRGALAQVAKNFYGDPHRLKLVGVTGTKGKTSVTHFIHAIFQSAGIKSGLIGTNGAFVGSEAIDIPYQTSSTPDIIELYRIFAHMAGAGASHAVMEATSHGLVQRRMEGITFDLGAFTNISHDHLDYHKTFENYIRAKALLFGRSRRSLINRDDANAASMAENAAGPVVYFGIGRVNGHTDGYFAENVELMADGIRFVVKIRGKTHRMAMKIPGRFSVYNALAALGAAAEMGVDPDDIAAGLLAVDGVPGRFERIDNGKGLCVIVDYAHSPDALENIISAVREFTTGRVITLFGCGGDRDAAKRPVMGEIAGRLSDFCVVSSDNPRNEDQMAIITEILPGLDKTGTKYRIEPERGAAIEAAITMARPGDSVIIAGKGHEPYQEFENRRREVFDDRAEARRVLGC